MDVKSYRSWFTYAHLPTYQVGAPASSLLTSLIWKIFKNCPTAPLRFVHLTGGEICLEHPRKDRHMVLRQFVKGDMAAYYLLFGSDGYV